MPFVVERRKNKSESFVAAESLNTTAGWPFTLVKSHCSARVPSVAVIATVAAQTVPAASVARQNCRRLFTKSYTTIAGSVVDIPPTGRLFTPLAMAVPRAPHAVPFTSVERMKYNAPAPVT